MHKYFIRYISQHTQECWEVVSETRDHVLSHIHALQCTTLEFISYLKLHQPKEIKLTKYVHQTNISIFFI